jgi:hypothetical protein
MSKALVPTLKCKTDSTGIEAPAFTSHQSWCARASPMEQSLYVDGLRSACTSLHHHHPRRRVIQ